MAVSQSPSLPVPWASLSMSSLTVSQTPSAPAFPFFTVRSFSSKPNLFYFSSRFSRSFLSSSAYFLFYSFYVPRRLSSSFLSSSALFPFLFVVSASSFFFSSKQSALVESMAAFHGHKLIFTERKSTWSSLLWSTKNHDVFHDSNTVNDLFSKTWSFSSDLHLQINFFIFTSTLPFGNTRTFSTTFWSNG